MIPYVDASAVVKLYVEEPESGAARELLRGHGWATAVHTYAEVRRGLWHALGEPALSEARAHFEDDWSEAYVLDVDESLCRDAARLIEETGVKTLDALHLSAARRAGSVARFITFDVKQADAARSLGWHVLPE